MRLSPGRLWVQVVCFCLQEGFGLKLCAFVSRKILAYERDGKRMTLLRQQLRKVGVTNTTPIHQDFLSVNPQDPQFADVRYIMVDPSCSGSGLSVCLGEGGGGGGAVMYMCVWCV